MFQFEDLKNFCILAYFLESRQIELREEFRIVTIPGLKSNFA